MSMFLGIDLGTTLIKAAVFDSLGRLRGLGRAKVNQEDGAGASELRSEVFWSVLSQAVGEALRNAQAASGDISALSYSSQANSFVLLDSKGQCLTPIVLWPDRRAECLDSGVTELWRQDDFLATTGIGLESIEFCAFKLDWFRIVEPLLWKRMAYVQTISDYLVYCLTGKRFGDTSTASMLGLWDQRNTCWWPEGLQRLHLAPEVMSTPLRPGTVAGELDATGAERLGLRSGIPLVVGGLDHYMAALGAGLGSLADVCESTGTVLACVALTEQYKPLPLHCVGPSRRPGQYYQLGFQSAGTTRLDWYQAHRAPEIPIPKLIDLAASAPPGANGLRVQLDATSFSYESIFSHLHPLHDHSHCVRALLESSALALSELIDGMGLAKPPKRILATGGGARSDAWLQIKADLLGMEVLQVDCEEPACQGAAMAAAVATGQLADFDAASALFHRVKRRFTPDAARYDQYQEIFGTRKTAAPSHGGV